MTIPTLAFGETEGGRDGVGPVLRKPLLFFVTSLLSAACGPPEPSLPPVSPETDAKVCAAASGLYKATFTLRETSGTCEEAKETSRDPLEFDASGRFLSPAEGLVECKTAQSGCELAVRCTSSVASAKAALDATVSEDGETITGTGTVEGAYKGCKRVVYDVLAVRSAPSAE